MVYDWREVRPYGVPARNIFEVRTMLRIINYIEWNYLTGAHLPASL